MEPFSLVCKSCAVRLKVSNASSVGQILACPKCGTMIEVDPPPGWKPPEPIQKSEDTPISSGSLDGQFEDIDSILAKPDSVRSKRTAQEKRSSKKPDSPIDSDKLSVQIHTKRSQQAARKTTQGQNQTPSEPVLPNDQWTSETSKQRKTLTLIVAGIVGSVVIVAAISAAVLFNGPKQTAGIPDPNGSHDSQIPNTDSKTASTAPPPNDKDPETQDTTDLLDEDPIKDPTVEMPDLPPGIGTSPPTIPEADQKPNPLDPASGEPIDDTLQEPKDSELKNTSSPFGSPAPKGIGGNADQLATPNENDPANQSLNMATGVKNKLGDLASLLEQRGTSIRDLQEATASRRARRFIGIPKYIIKRPNPLEIDLDRKLALPIGGLDYDSPQHLVHVLRQLSTISGVPVTVNAQAIVEAGKEPNPVLATNITGASLDKAFTQLLTIAGLEKQNHELGIVVSAPLNPTMIENQFELPSIPALDEQSRQELIAIIKTMINPETWVRESLPATLEIDGVQLTANCSQDSKHKIDILIERLAAAAALVQDPDDAIANRSIQSRWRSVLPNLAKSPGLFHAKLSRIGVFLDRLNTATDTTVLVDWVHVGQLGWTPQTTIPGNLSEPTLEETLAELCQSMNLTDLAIDRKTVVLTTYEQAENSVDLEVYSTAKLLTGPLNEKKIEALIFQTLGRQLQAANVRFVYEPHFQCLIVSAPQSLQRQIDELMKQLESL